jgi:hypothetical protein
MMPFACAERGGEPCAISHDELVARGRELGSALE